MKEETYTIYFAGSLFNLRELHGNVHLVERFLRYSDGHYRFILPQDLEQRTNTSKSIRDQDIKAVIESDFILANYDGTELDSGTVVEYMISKFLDIPAVLLRTDFREYHEAFDSDPWNLMTSHYPRTEVVLLDGMSMYKSRNEDRTAVQVIEAFNKLKETKPIISDKEIQISAYNWLNAVVGFENPYTKEELGAIIQRKRKKGLL